MTQRRTSHGFALATVLIASTVMLTVLVVSVQATAAIRTNLQQQYYNTLARTAAESGTAFAESCLANNTSNPGAPQWSSSTPLLVNTGCDGNVYQPCNASANTSACTVATNNGDVTSSFSVAYPTIDTTITDANYGDATSLSVTGIVNVLRTSQQNTNNSPWRTYKVTINTNLVTPSFCSPYNTATSGWTNAIASTYAYSFPSDNRVTAITFYDQTTLPGTVYYRKDFNVSTAGTYTLSSLADNRGEVSLDGQLVQTSIYPTTATNTITLTAGCHTVVDKVTNYGTAANTSALMLDITQSGATSDLLDTDTTWRVVSGQTADFTTPQYYVDPISWTPVADFGGYAATSEYGAGPASWLTSSGDAYSQYISTPAGNTSNNSAYNYPYAEYSVFRDSQPVTLATTTTVNVSAACDNSCNVYMDGTQLFDDSNTVTSSTISIPAGTHTFAVELYNGGTSTNPSAFVFGAVRTSDGVVLTSSDEAWQTTDVWSTAFSDPQSYDTTFAPSNLPTTTSSGPTITNLATNPSFETGVANTTPSSATVTSSTIWATAGTHSLAILPTSSSSVDSFSAIGLDAGNGMQLGMLAGHTYTLSATVDIPTALTGTISFRSAGLGLYYISTAFGTYREITVHPPNIAGVYNLSLTIYLPTDTTQSFVRLYDGALSGGGSVYWDGVSLTDVTSGPTPATYRDGGSTNWVWNGTAGSSSSTGPASP
jgi:Tfp pilus assembly protein PilX